MIAGIQAEYPSDAESTKDTQYFILMGKMYFLNIFDKIDCIITAPYCSEMFFLYQETFGSWDYKAGTCLKWQ